MIRKNICIKSRLHTNNLWAFPPINRKMANFRVEQVVITASNFIRDSMTPPTP